jgi:hypothetical protein
MEEEMKGKVLFQVLAMAVALLFAGSTGVMAASVTPTEIPQVSGGAADECSVVGTYDCSFKIDEWQNQNNDGTYTAVCTNPDPPNDDWSTDITISNSNNLVFDWSSSPSSIGAVLVKSATVITVFQYDPQVFSDTGLYTLNNQEISHVTFCYNFEEQVANGQWCSPGYWRNHPEEADVAAASCHFDLDVATYSDEFGGVNPPRSPKGVKDGAPEDPTLRELLNHPEWYGGEAYNTVGDLLSRCHEGVNFTGERVPDSCPLN